MNAREQLIATGVLEPATIPERFRVDLGVPVLRLDEHGRRTVRRHLGEGYMAQVPDQLVDAPARLKRRRRTR